MKKAPGNSASLTLPLYLESRGYLMYKILQMPMSSMFCSTWTECTRERTTRKGGDGARLCGEL